MADTFHPYASRNVPVSKHYDSKNLKVSVHQDAAQDYILFEYGYDKPYYAGFNRTETISVHVSAINGAISLDSRCISEAVRACKFKKPLENYPMPRIYDQPVLAENMRLFADRFAGKDASINEIETGERMLEEVFAESLKKLPPAPVAKAKGVVAAR